MIQINGTTKQIKNASTTLKRTLSFWQLTFYGIGTILGAGIYVLIGEVAAVAGIWTPLSFMIAALLAALTGLSFAELSSRYPYSAGEAVYVEEAFKRQWLSAVVGLAVVLTGIVSSATLVNGFAGYFREFVDVPNLILIPLVCIVLCIVAAWGIAESVSVAVVITVVEIIGLIVVVVVALPIAIDQETTIPIQQNISDITVWLGILSGAGIAFYAFIGFEDMVNVAEEVKDVRSVLPKAIIITLIITTLLYFAVALVSIRALSLEELTSTDAPLAIIFNKSVGSSTFISIIALFAVMNGALIQIIMATRVFYGGAKQGWLPKIFSQINQTTKTPIFTTILITFFVLIFSLWLPLGTLARLTSFIILLIFTLINIALIKIKLGNQSQDNTKIYPVPLWVPIVGAIASFIFAITNGIVLFNLFN